MQALLVCNQLDENAVLTTVLQQAGFTVRTIQDMDRVVETWPELPAELVMIALPAALPSQKSVQQVQQIRAQTAVNIIVVCEMIPEEMHILLLQNGADIVILRPYSAALLIARIRALLRRSGGVPFFSLPSIHHSGITLDPSNRTVSVHGGAPRHLTQLEFRLLYTLMTHTGQIIPTDTIVQSVWGYSGEGNRELVRGLVQRLRSKIETDTRKPQHICTEAGIGYFFSLHPQSQQPLPQNGKQNPE